MIALLLATAFAGEHEIAVGATFDLHQSKAHAAFGGGPAVAYRYHAAGWTLGGGVAVTSGFSTAVRAHVELGRDLVPSGVYRPWVGVRFVGNAGTYRIRSGAHAATSELASSVRGAVRPVVLHSGAWSVSLLEGAVGPTLDGRLGGLAFSVTPLSLARSF